MKLVLEYLNTLLKDYEFTRKEKETLLNQKIIEANEIKKVISKLSLNDNSTFNVFNASGSKIEFQNKEVIELKSQEDRLKLEADQLAEEIRNLNLKIEELAITIGHANSSSNKILELSNDVIRLNAEVAMYSTGAKKYADPKDKMNSELKHNLKELEYKIDKFDAVTNNITSSNPITEYNSVDNFVDNTVDNSVQDSSFEMPTEMIENETVRLSSSVEPVDIQIDDKSFLQEVADRVYFISKILKFDPVRVNLELDEIYKAIIKHNNQ